MAGKAFKLIFCCSVIYIFCPIDSEGQEIIPLLNPSFEGYPRPGIIGIYLEPKFDLQKEYELDINKPLVVKDWLDCGLMDFPDETPPDVHPDLTQNLFQVDKQPSDGKTYLGLVTRYNDSFEAVSQKLKKSLKKGKCYTLHGYLAISENYKSLTKRSTTDPEDFSHPVQLRIWGGSRANPKQEMLAQSGPVENYEWKKYEFKLFPTSSHTYFTIEAFFIDGVEAPYNGHVLVDNFSSIREISCQ